MCYNSARKVELKCDNLNNEKKKSKFAWRNEWPQRKNNQLFVLNHFIECYCGNSGYSMKE